MAKTVIDSPYVRPTTDPVPPGLKPYPFPEGMEVPRLMPYQDYPWNGDHHLAAEVLRLKEAHGLTMAIETGTCLGSTTCWLAENFKKVATIETNGAFLDIAYARTKGYSGRIQFFHDDSAKVLRKSTADGLFFLDAHWGPNCPLLDELDALANIGGTIVIVIHDFFVPGTDFGYDCMPDGRPFNLELIQGHLDRIYGEGKWKYNYPTQVAGAKRGWISVEPC